MPIQWGFKHRIAECAHEYKPLCVHLLCLNILFRKRRCCNISKGNPMCRFLYLQPLPDLKYSMFHIHIITITPNLFKKSRQLKAPIRNNCVHTPGNRKCCTRLSHPLFNSHNPCISLNAYYTISCELDIPIYQDFSCWFTGERGAVKHLHPYLPVPLAAPCWPRYFPAPCWCCQTELQVSNLSVSLPKNTVYHLLPPPSQGGRFQASSFCFPHSPVR